MFKYQNRCNKTEVTIISTIITICTIGMFLNFQNLWQYWPSSGKLVDVPIQWIVSVIGVFVPPLGVFTGWVL